MSQTQIQSAVSQIYKTFSPSLIDRLKRIANLQNAGGSSTTDSTSTVQTIDHSTTITEPKPKLKVQYEDETEETIDTTTTPDSKLSKIEESKSESENSKIPESNTNLSKALNLPSSFVNFEEKEIFIKADGSYDIGKREVIDSKSMLISDLLKFENEADLNAKSFSSNEIVFLLHSSYFPHKTFAVNRVKKFVTKNISNIDLIHNLLISKDILDSALNVVESSPKTSQPYNLALHAIIECFISTLFKRQADPFDLIKITNADMNTMSTIWFEKLHTEIAKIATEVYEKVFTKYDFLNRIVASYINQSGVLTQENKFINLPELFN